MNLDRFSGPGSTPSRRRFWDKVQEAVMASRKVEGRHVKIDEHPGAGSVINVDDTSTRRPTGPGACCYDDGTCDDLTESECTDAGGNWLGIGTTCEVVDCTQGACCAVDGTCSITTSGECSGEYQGNGTVCEPNPCSATGACCVDGDCSITTEADCTGIYKGDGTTCEDSNCDLCSDCSAFFNAFDGSGGKFLTYHAEMVGTHTRSTTFTGDPPCVVQYDASSTVDKYYDSSCSLVESSSCSSTRDNSCNPDDNCSLGTLECFCNSGSPPHCDNFCISFVAWECGVCSGGDCGSDNTVTTATTRTRTVIFCQSCTFGALSCDVSGSYVLTETLSDECASGFSPPP